MIHCLHGAAGHHRNWDHFCDSLKTPVHPLDLWRLFDQAEPSLTEAGKVIADQANPQDILLGYSLGGRLALHALLADPGKWHAAVIVSAHPGLTEGRPARLEHDRKWAELARDDWPLFLERWNAQPVLGGSLHGLRPAPPADRLRVAASFRQWSLGTQENLRPRLSSIACPVLWLTGENDQKFTRLATEAISLLPQGKHLILPRCGHRLPWEQPSLFQAAVQNFLANHRIHPSISS